MSCVLAVCPTAEADLQGTQDATFEVAISSKSGTATLNYALYNKVSKTTAPFSFVIAKGVNVLTLVVESTVMLDRISVNEVTDGCSQVLDAFNYDPSNGPDGLEIKAL